MRCQCCNVALNDLESTRRVVSTGEFLDWCNKCYKGMEQDIPTYSNVPEEEDLNDDYFPEEKDLFEDDEWDDS